jgi:CelD/BcsL family acetyltransferase involved in cellulose biosynthesis
MTLFGDDFVYSKNADVDHCCSLVFDALHREDFDLSILEGIDTDSRLWHYCATANGQPRGLRLVRSSRRTDKSFNLELPKSFAEYLATLGSSTRGSLKRRTKKLLADHSGKLIKVVLVDQVRSFLDDVDKIFRDSWQSKTYGEVKRNRDAEIARLEHVARQGWLSSYLLTSDLGPLAFQIGYRYGNTYYACDFAFARNYSSLGPGATLMYLMIEDLFRDDPPRVVDFRAGDSPQKRTFRGVPRDVGNYYVIPSNRWRHFVNAQRGLSEFESIVRTALVRMRLDDVLRRILKHKQ